MRTRWLLLRPNARFPVRIRIGIPPDGLGSRLDRIKAWLDENCGPGYTVETADGVFQVRED